MKPITPFLAAVTLTLLVSARGATAAEPQPPAPSAAPAGGWAVGEPIVTYYAGPPMSEAVARQMAEGGFNVVWCGPDDLDLLRKHGLRGMLRDPLLAPAALDADGPRGRLDALVDRVRAHPALYAYYITDEPSAAAFPGLGKLVAHLRERDPAHVAYINLFPTYASNEQLGTTGDVATAYDAYLRQFLDVVRPGLLSYDHYQFYKGRDTDQYFLNLAMARRAAQGAGVPFLNIVQAAAWQPEVRVPDADETRYLLYTTLAYGAQGVSYYVYGAPGHEGGVAAADGTPTPIYAALKTLNPEFVAVATELQPLRSLGVYHTALTEPGCAPLPADAAFRPGPAAPAAAGAGAARGLLLGYFGPPGRPTHAVVVNLDYKAEARHALDGPADLEVFDAAARTWRAAGGRRADLALPPGGGKLVRLAK